MITKQEAIEIFWKAGLTSIAMKLKYGLLGCKDIKVLKSIVK